MKPPIKPDEIHMVNYPFARTKYDKPSDDYSSTLEVDSWVPGVRFEQYNDGDADAFADGMGFMSLRVVSVVKPGKYPERVFYVRQWVDPDGAVFGKTQLRIASTTKFRNLLRGYRHDFEMSQPCEVPA